MKGRKNLNTMLSERHELNKIALSELKKDVEKTRQFSSYFSKMADLLLFLNEIYDTKEKSLEQLKQWNKIWYEEVSPEKYVDSLGNPAFCVQEYGKDYGQIFSFLYTEMRSGFIYAIEGRLFDLVINNELFLEISNLFLAGEEHPQQIKNIIFDHMRDYSEDVYEYRVREQLDPELNFATKIVMESDLSNPDILYQYGEYISKNEIDMLKFLNKLPREEITAMAKTYVDGFHDDKYGIIVENAIRNHSAFRIDERLDEYTVMFCNILRDADKVDIFRVNVDTPAEDIYNVTTEELKNSQVSPEVMAAFDERHAVLRSCKKTVVDHVAGHIALTFELVYPISLQIANERGYLDKMMAFESDNEVTGKQFEEIRAKLNEYVASVKPL